MTPNEVEELFLSCKQLNLRESVASDPEDDEEDLGANEKAHRVEKLHSVLETVQELLAAGSMELDLVAQKIGDGSRDSSWRISLGEVGLLNFFIGLIGNPGLRQTLTVQTLRVIGNSCADTDENRARVVDAGCLPTIVNLLNDDSTLAFAIPVLFNICVDYEPAQVAAYKAGLNPELISLISGPRKEKAAASMGMIYKLLGLVANQEPEANYVHPSTPFVLLTVATSPASLEDLDDFLGETSVALTYLSHPQFQESFLETPHSIALFLRAFSHACVDVHISELEPDEATQLKNVRSVFTQALADLSDQPLFAASCHITSPEAQMLTKWISTPNVALQTAACLALGNVSRSDETCIALVQELKLHQPLKAVLSDPSNADAQLLHSVLGFLKNLAIPASNKPILGGAGLFEPNILPRIWKLDTQVQVQFAAVSLTRLLLISCPSNVSRLCAPLASGSASPVGEGTCLGLLIATFMRSDQQPTKTEAARAVSAVLRVLHSASEPEIYSLLSVASAPNSASSLPSTSRLGTQAEDLLSGFYASHEAIDETLLYLGKQSKFPVLRSELWFVLALMSRSPAASAVVATCFQHGELLQALYEVVTGSSDILTDRELDTASDTDTVVSHAMQAQAGLIPGSNVVVQGGEEVGVGGIEGLGLEPQQVDPKQKADMARVDRENGLVLVAELLQRCPEKFSPSSLEVLKEMLKTGGQMVLNDRQDPK